MKLIFGAHWSCTITDVFSALFAYHYIDLTLI